MTVSPRAKLKGLKKEAFLFLVDHKGYKGMARDGKGWQDMARNGKGWQGTARDGMAWDGIGW